jgi:group II intron reverse transcriptase/maturase
MLNYLLSIKTLFPNMSRNGLIRSGNESHLRGRVHLKNSWQVTLYKVRLTKLSLHAHLPLDNDLTRYVSFRSWSSTRIYRGPLIVDLEPCNQQPYMKQRPKYSIDGILGTVGHSKGRKPYGGGDSVRESGFRRFSSTSNISVKSCVGLEELMNLNKKNPNYINDKLIHIVSDTKVLILAYEIVKSKSGNTTLGIDSFTLDDKDLKWFNTISEKLKAGKFKFKPARRVYIPKLGKEIKRSLTISSYRDKVVQQAIFLILNAIYEFSFLESSHGSRPNLGTHTALQSIKYKFDNVKWCIESGIENNFLNIDHKILLNLLSKRIVCSKFLALIKNYLKVGYVEDGKFFTSNKGIFQGTVISPILNNIYLHQLDLFMLELSEAFAEDESRIKSPIFRRIPCHMEKAAGDIPTLKKLRRKLGKVNSKDSLGLNFKRLYYIRHDDGFIVGVIGSFKETVGIRNKIDGFLKSALKLTLSSEKTIITHFSKKPIFFLGTFIKRNWQEEKKVVTMKRTGVTRKVRVASRTVLIAPIKSIFEKAAVNGFFKKLNGKFIPTKVGKCINLDHTDILRYYNSVIHGVLNYYSFVNNRKSLVSFVHGLKFSCARTLALKYKLRHASKIFKKFGSKLKSPCGKVELFVPTTLKYIKQFNINTPLPDDVLFNNWNNKLIKNNLFKACIICGSSDHIQMHHVRKIRNLKMKAIGKCMDFSTMQMAAVNCKQVPLCAVHHKFLHKNILTIAERKLFTDNVSLLK